jgi:hypothetical protein
MAGGGFAVAGQRGPRDLGRGGLPGGVVPPGPPPPNRAPIQDMIEGFYVSRLQQELNLGDDQFVQILPSIRGSLEQRNQLSQQHNRVRNALEEAIENGASDQELSSLIEQFDQSDRELRNVQDRLLDEIDPSLSIEQRARFRIVQPAVEGRVRELIERSRAGAEDRRPPGPAR